MEMRWAFFVYLAPEKVIVQEFTFNSLIHLFFSVWYHFTQISFFIGTVCGTIAMFVTYSNHEGRHLCLSPTTKSMVLLMLSVAGKNAFLILTYICKVCLSIMFLFVTGGH